jgi:hypothetical protein
MSSAITRGRALVALFAVTALVAGAMAALPGAPGPLGALTPGTAQAYTGGCSGLSCTFYLNRSESVAFATSNWRPSYWAVRAVYGGLRPIARGWINRGYCVAYVVSLVPWQGQGLMGWRC